MRGNNEFYVSFASVEILQINLFIGRPRAAKYHTQSIPFELLYKIEMVVSLGYFGYAVKTSVTTHRYIGKA